jgi:hypothetical protein
MQNDAKKPGETLCPGCGRNFVCGMQAGQTRCWCADLPALPVPRPQVPGCYCADCLRRLHEQATDA